MTVMGLDLVEREALMMYHTRSRLKGSQNWPIVTLILRDQVSTTNVVRSYMIERNLEKLTKKANPLFFSSLPVSHCLLISSSVNCCISISLSLHVLID